MYYYKTIEIQMLPFCLNINGYSTAVVGNLGRIKKNLRGKKSTIAFNFSLGPALFSFHSPFIKLFHKNVPNRGFQKSGFWIKVTLPKYSYRQLIFIGYQFMFLNHSREFQWSKAL